MIDKKYCIVIASTDKTRIMTRNLFSMDLMNARYTFASKKTGRNVLAKIRAIILSFRGHVFNSTDDSITFKIGDTVYTAKIEL